MQICHHLFSLGLREIHKHKYNSSQDQLKFVFGGILQPLKVSLLPQNTSTHTLPVHFLKWSLLPVLCSSAPRLVDQASRDESFTVGRETKMEGMRLQLHAAYKKKSTCELKVKHVAFAVQVCGLPHTEMQEHCQTTGGPATGMQPKSVPGADSCSPQQNRLQRCGSRLVLISVATGQFLNFTQHLFYSCNVASNSKNNTYIQK